MKRVILTSLIVGYTYPLLQNNDIEIVTNPKNEKLIQAIKNCPSLQQPFIPSFWIPHGFLQTCILGFPINRKDTWLGKWVPLYREEVKTEKRGTVTLDWAIEKAPKGYKGKILIVGHGLTGGADTKYIQCILDKFKNYEGYYVVVVNQKGICNSKVDVVPAWHVGFTEDIRLGIKYIQEQYPEAKLLGLGTSMGAQWLLKYSSEEGENNPLKALVVISTPFDLLVINKFLIRHQNFIWDYFLAKGCKNVLRNNYQINKQLESQTGCDVDKALSQYRTKDFEKFYTVKNFNFPTFDIYYRTQTCINFIHQIKIPVLAIHAEDDPVCVWQQIPRDEFEVFDNLALAITKHGGHLCWFEGARFKNWYVKPAAEFLNQF